MIFKRRASRWKKEGQLEVTQLSLFYHKNQDPLYHFEPLALYLVDDEFSSIMSFAFIIYGYFMDLQQIFIHCPFMIILNTVECLRNRSFSERFILAHILAKTYLNLNLWTHWPISLQVWFIEVNIILIQLVLACNPIIQQNYYKKIFYCLGMVVFVIANVVLVVAHFQYFLGIILKMLHEF